jgi:hypothetical protein
LEVNGKWVVTSAAKSFSPQETQKLLFKASILFRGTWAEPNCAGGAAGGGGGLGVAEMNMKKCYAAVVPAMIATMMFALPADARAKKSKRPDAQKRYELHQTPQSLDGRTLGRTRTCGFDYLQYDGLGTPYGPYCH